jgi:mRNA-degrading endonuclease RelE of RelBE toxin-antitoxin system
MVDKKRMTYKLKYNPDVKKSDLPKIDSKNRNLIKKALKEQLSKQPEIYGKPLQRTLKKILEARSRKLPFCF